MHRGITSITPRSGMGTNPASARRSTGEVFVNQEIWGELTPDQRLWILLHEEGHIALNTTNELEADRYAAQKYFRMGGSLKASLQCMMLFLNGGEVNRKRIRSQIERALLYDWQVNHNQKALQIFKKLSQWQKK